MGPHAIINVMFVLKMVMAIMAQKMALMAIMAIMATAVLKSNMFGVPYKCTKKLNQWGRDQLNKTDEQKGSDFVCDTTLKSDLFTL